MERDGQDMLRNDLGRTCTMGSVQVEDIFSVERYETRGHSDRANLSRNIFMLRKALAETTQEHRYMRDRSRPRLPIRRAGPGSRRCVDSG